MARLKKRVIGALYGPEFMRPQEVVFLQFI
jgi:hypothetical protein